MSEEKSKSIRDEQTLAKVLEAAYVMQEHNRELKKKEQNSELKRKPLAEQQPPIPRAGMPKTQDATPRADTAQEGATSTLAQIVEIQHQIQVRHLELENVMSLVAERLARIAGAGSAAIGILEGQKVHYRAGAGVMALPAGTQVPMEKALCVACLRTGRVFRCGDSNSEILLNTDECRRRGIRSMIAVPVFRDGGVAGSLELYSPEPRAFTEEDVRACQLMAGLMAEALARNEEARWKKSLASERTVMLEALAKLQPNLAALADIPAAKNFAAIAGNGSAESNLVCRACGHELPEQEQFCGNCGWRRSADYEAPSSQKPMTSLLDMQEALKKNAPAQLAHGAVVHEESAKLNLLPGGESIADAIDEPSSAFFADLEPVTPEHLRHETIESRESPEAQQHADFENAADADLEIPLHSAEDEVEEPKPTAVAKPERSRAWRSAATTLDFFEQLASAKDRGWWTQFWNTRRGDIYLAIAAVLLIGVIRWGVRSNHAMSATGNPALSAAHHRAAPDPGLSLFDRILVKLGLAEAPEPPEYKGNPATQVWIDLHTALYYCPGADLYGRTPQGKFSSQRAAQLDQFEPAYRRACD